MTQEKKIKLKRKINAYSPDEVLVKRAWFECLKEMADKFEKDPSNMNKLILLGYIDSASFIIKKL